MFRLTRNGRGFTLVELLAVIALLALAIGAALPDVPGLDAPPEAADVPPVTNVVYYTLEFEQSVDAAEKEAALRAGFASADGKFLELLRPRFRSESDTLCVGLWLPGDADPEMHVEALREVSGAASVAPTPLSLLAAADSDEDEV